jgi:hypothetical protein
MMQVKMWCILLSVAVAAYIVVGSCIFPDWWFALFWDRKRGLFRGIRKALRDLLDEHIWLLLLVVLFAFGVLIAGIALSRWLMPVTNRHSWLILVPPFAILIDAIILYQLRKGPYRVAMAALAIVIKLLATLQDLGTVSSGHKIVPPIHFHYVNSEAVEALYGQIEPDLKLAQRTVATTGALHGNVSVGLSKTNVGAEARRLTALEDKLTAIPFGVQRKCVDLMVHVSSVNAELFYSTEGEWYLRRFYQRFLEPILHGLRTLDLHSTQRAASIAKKMNPEGEIARVRNELISELRSLQGLVFLVGDFNQYSREPKLTLIREFVTSPTKCSFRVTLPPNALDSLPTGGPLHLTILGAVSQPLGDSGFIDVDAVAIF